MGQPFKRRKVDTNSENINNKNNNENNGDENINNDNRKYTDIIKEYILPFRPYHMDLVYVENNLTYHNVSTVDCLTALIFCDRDVDSAIGLLSDDYILDTESNTKYREIFTEVSDYLYEYGIEYS